MEQNRTCSGWVKNKYGLEMEMVVNMKRQVYCVEDNGKHVLREYC